MDTPVKHHQLYATTRHISTVFLDGNHNICTASIMQMDGRYAGVPDAEGMGNTAGDTSLVCILACYAYFTTEMAG